VIIALLTQVRYTALMTSHFHFKGSMKPNITYRFLAYLALLMGTLVSSNAYSVSPQPPLKLTEQEKAWLTQHPVIRVSPDANYRPIESLMDGQHSGMSGDYFKLISEMLGVEFRVVPHKTWPDSLASMDAGRIDLLPLIHNTLYCA